MSGEETSVATPINGLNLEVKRQPHVLTIAGSDSSGGAGIQADLKTFAAFDCYGASVLTGLTAQNTTGVQAVHEVPSDFLESVCTDDFPSAIKFGMLTSASTIRALASCPHLTERPSTTLAVLDPVMISTSGHTLLPDDAIDALRGLFKSVDWLTPNIPEARRLSGPGRGGSESKEVSGVQDLLDLAEATVEACDTPVVLLKGGHFPISRREVKELGERYRVIYEEGDDEQDTIECLNLWRKGLLGAQAEEKGKVVVDILMQRGAQPTLFVGKHVESRSTHGTGCTLSSAIAAAYATSHPTEDGAERNVAIARRAIEYTRSAISTAYAMGQGHGPLNHSHLTTPRGLPPPTRTNPHPFVSHLIQSDMPLWKSYVRHPFVVQLGKGTLPRDAFEHYIKQDYHYLRHYARAHSLGAYKCTAFEDMQAFTQIAMHIAQESEMHVSYCGQFGVTRAQLLSEPESAACSAYARYIIDVGTQGDVLDLYVAIAACLIGYGEVGLWLQKQVGRGEAVMEGNVYRRWMEDYAGLDFIGAVNRGIENLEKRVAEERPTPERLARLTAIWHEVVRLERNFWDMGLNKLY